VHSICAFTEKRLSWDPAKSRTYNQTVMCDRIAVGLIDLRHLGSNSIAFVAFRAVSGAKQVLRASAAGLKI
jgi:hypothetical protein